MYSRNPNRHDIITVELKGSTFRRQVAAAAPMQPLLHHEFHHGRVFGFQLRHVRQVPAQLARDALESIDAVGSCGPIP